MPMAKLIKEIWTRGISYYIDKHPAYENASNAVTIAVSHNSNEHRPLHFAAIYEDEKLLDICLAYPRQNLSVDRYLYTALDYAVRNNNIRFVKKILEAKIATFLDDSLPLALCIENKQYEMLAYLLSTGKFNVNSTDREEGQLPLNICLYMNDTRSMLMLLDAGAEYVDNRIKLNPQEPSSRFLQKYKTGKEYCKTFCQKINKGDTEFSKLYVVPLYFCLYSKSIINQNDLDPNYAIMYQFVPQLWGLWKNAQPADNNRPSGAVIPIQVWAMIFGYVHHHDIWKRSDTEPVPEGVDVEKESALACIGTGDFLSSFIEG